MNGRVIQEDGDDEGGGYAELTARLADVDIRPWPKTDAALANLLNVASLIGFALGVILSLKWLFGLL